MKIKFYKEDDILVFSFSDKAVDDSLIRMRVFWKLIGIMSR